MDRAIVVVSERLTLQPVANAPVVCHALEALARAGAREAAVTVDASLAPLFAAELEDRRAGLKVSYREHDGSGGLGSALAGLDDFVADEPFALHLGDSLSHGSLGSVLDAPRGALDVVILREDSAIGGPVQMDSRELGPVAGVWILGGGTFDAVSTVPSSGSMELDMRRATDRVAERGGTVSNRHVGDWWRYRGGSSGLLDANRFALSDLRSEPIRADVADSLIQGPVRAHPSARLRNAVVRGPAIIGARACLTDAYVGPYSSVGNDVVIEGAEIEHSIILAGASIRHLGGRLEASIVGPGARVFRDFRLPRALRLNVGEDAEISLT